MNREPMSRVVRGVCVPALAAAMALSASLTYAQNSALEPSPHGDEWWAQRHEEKKALVQQGGVDLLFVGDSITHGWEGAGAAVWEEYYGDRNAANIGYGGDQTQQVLWRFENGELDGILPKLAVVMIGTNNSYENTAEEIAEGVSAVVNALREKLPSTKVLLLAIFPREDQPQEYRDKLARANAILDEAEFDDAVHFLDIGPWFLDPDGSLPQSVMPDLLHPNEAGYQLWAEAIEPKVADLLGEPAPKGWKRLFNGENLTGWEPVGSDSWHVGDGMLYTVGGEGGWLSTDREYGDVDLQLAFRVPDGGNSGVFLHTPRTGNPAFEGIEIQLIDDYTDAYGELQPWQLTGSVYATAAPSREVALSAGQWQTIRIRAVGHRVMVIFNDTPIVNLDRSKAQSHSEEHPGLMRTSGYIGLQNHGSRFDFRNIWIRELASEAASE